MKKQELLSYLYTYLNQANWTHDSSANGLQVDNTKTDIYKIGYAVDVTTYIIDKALEHNIDMLITHHGMFWWYQKTITGMDYQRIKRLLDNNIALYSSHLPLDAHHEVGNNIWLINAWKRIFALTEKTIEPFGDYKWSAIGYVLESTTPVPIAGILMPYCDKMWLCKQLYNFGDKEYITRIAIVSWWAGDAVREAKQKNVDLFITWEMVHHQLTLAKELKQSILLGWHYETEKIWVKLLCHHLSKQFSAITCVYIDEKY